MTSQTPIRIAVLDDYAGLAEKQFRANQAFTIEHYESFPDTVDPKTPDGLAALASRLAPFTVISTMRERTPFPAALLSALPNLKLLLTTSKRNASIDLVAAQKLGILVSGTTPRAPDGHASAFHPPSSTHDSTTQQALSLLLSLTSRIPHDHARLTSSPAWQSGLSVPLHGKTLGIIGLGRLGTNFARLCVNAFDMRILAWSPNLTQERADAAALAAGLEKGRFEAAGKEQVLRSADVVSLHLVLSERSRDTIGAAELALLKPSAFLINTARAGLSDEDALLASLQAGRIAGAALDVFWAEPLPEKSVWRMTKWGEEGRSLVVLSPHMGYVNEETMGWWYEEQCLEVGRWAKGERLQNLMNA